MVLSFPFSTNFDLHNGNKGVSNHVYNRATIH
ncbi:hypothetical protein JOF28_002547 [Leucobacter exalbidus]|uniref:Uncharacterized protein n=1 Tax=Leucobacter exalbidus TaxID=662960 RepID=A0A940T1Y3_9MICO|nr:hypothetical protein [Leucobacter exalbidus]